MCLTVRNALLSIVVLTFFVGGCPAEGGETEDQAAAARTALEGFDELVRQAIADFNVPGLGIAVVAGGEVVYAEGFGFRDVESQKPMTPDSLFAIGSTTKAMTVTTLGMLVDQGKLDWDKPLRIYLPGFRLSDPLTTERITPRDLVTHRSGLPRHDLVWYNNDNATRAEIVAQLAYLELSEDLRAKFQYNNLMFMTAGYLAGQLEGTTWEEVVRERLFRPLGMQRSNFSVEVSERDADHALPYRENDDENIERIPFRNINLVGPAGSVNSSVNEMARWLLFNLRGGMVDGQQLINAATLADIHSPHMTTGSTPDRPDISVSTYGMGWMITTYRGHRRISHGGGIDGFITSVVFFPDADIGLVVFNNRGSGLPQLVAQHAADRILGLDQVDWIGEALEDRRKARAASDQAEKQKEATRVAGTTESHPLSDYTGEYDHPGYGTLRILAAGNGLELTFNDITSPLEHWHYDVWNGGESVSGDATFEDEKFIFRSNLDGLIAAVEVRFEPRGEPIVFKKQFDQRLADPAFLQEIAGTYEMSTGMKLHIELSGQVLTLSIPGQQLMTLEPDLSGRFVIKEYRVVSLGFEFDEHGRAIKATMYQPDGVYEALRVE
ncbi:MAG: serine hydrolase [bacterium]|nr:serine hydrolase [bacterium]